MWRPTNEFVFSSKIKCDIKIKKKLILFFINDFGVYITGETNNIEYFLMHNTETNEIYGAATMQEYVKYSKAKKKSRSTFTVLIAKTKSFYVKFWHKREI